MSYDYNFAGNPITLGIAAPPAPALGLDTVNKALYIGTSSGWTAVGGSGSSYAMNFSGGVTVALTNPKFPSAYALNLSAGDTDLYTVPANRKALLLSAPFTNPTGNGNSPIVLAEVKTGGVYHTFDFVSNGAPAGTYGSDLAVAPFLLAAGESFSVNCGSSGDSVWAFLVEFDATVPIQDARLFSLAAGNNTLFTVPASKTVAFMGFPASGSGGIQRGRVWYWNNTGANRIITMNAVPSGSSPSVNNQFQSAATAGNQQMVQQTFYGGLLPGDFININTDVNTATQTAYVIYTLL
jgi:hypothetical protein